MHERAVDELLDLLRRVFPPGPFIDRRLGRAFAFQSLYEMDLAHHAPTQVLERLAAALGESGPGPYPPEVLEGATRYAHELVKGVLAHRSAIDALIHERAPLWPLAQMSAIDRNVLRLGLYESLYGNATVPLRSAINEAVELAKLFGSETSAKFVNGVLGRAVEASAGGDASSATSPPQPRSSAAPGRPAQADEAPAAGETQEPGAAEPPTPAGAGERGFDDGRER